MKVENLLQDCIEAIQQGASVEECLAHYPEHTDELRPLHLVVGQMHSSHEAFLSYEAKQQHRRRRHAALSIREANQPTRPWHARLQSFVLAPRRLQLTAVALVVALFLGGVIVSSAEASLPHPRSIPSNARWRDFSSRGR